MIQFVIPSYNRVGAVTALDMFPTGYVPHLVVRESQKDDYIAYYGDKAQIIPIPDDVNGIAGTRRLITEMYQGQRIWMLDDDTTIHTTEIRAKDHRRILHDVGMTWDEFNKLTQYVEAAMDCGFYHGHARLPIFKIDSKWGHFRENSYGFTNTFYDLSKLSADDIGYGIVDLSEDTYAFLKLINMGYPHLAIFKYLVKSGKGQAPGGVSSMRNAAKQNRALEKIHADFPTQARWKSEGDPTKTMFGTDEPLKVLRMCVAKKQKSDAFKKFSEIEPTL